MNESTDRGSKLSLKQLPFKNKIFFNILIFILVVFISFILYSLYGKVERYFSSETQNMVDTTNHIVIQVEVLNGCGASGIADNFTSYLRSKSIDVVFTGNYRSFDIDNSLVIDRTGDVSKAENVAAVLGLNENSVIQQINKEYFLDVTVVVGKDFRELTPYR